LPISKFRKEIQLICFGPVFILGLDALRAREETNREQDKVMTNEKFEKPRKTMLKYLRKARWNSIQ